MADRLILELVVDDKGTATIKKFSQEARSGLDSIKDSAVKTSGTIGSMQNSFALVAAGIASTVYLAKNLFSLLQSLARPIIDAYKATEEFNQSTIKLGALITNLRALKPGEDLAEAYKDSKKYAEDLYRTLEKISPQVFGSARDLAMMTEEFAKQGVLLDINNKKEIDAFKNIANAVGVVSAGYANREMQIRQEARSLMEGVVKPTNVLAGQIQAMVSGPLKDKLEMWKKEGTVIENIGLLLKGYSAATSDISGTWESIKTTTETIYNKILREGLAIIYKDINEALLKMNIYLMENKDNIITPIKEIWESIRNIIGTVDLVRIIKGMENILWMTKDIAAGFNKIFGTETQAEKINKIFEEYTKNLATIQWYQEQIDKKGTSSIINRLFGVGYEKDLEQLKLRNVELINEYKKLTEGISKETSKINAVRPKLAPSPISEEEIKHQKKVLSDYYSAQSGAMKDELQLYYEGLQESIKIADKKWYENIKKAEKGYEALKVLDADYDNTYIIEKEKISKEENKILDSYFKVHSELVTDEIELYNKGSEESLKIEEEKWRKVVDLGRISFETMKTLDADYTKSYLIEKEKTEAETKKIWDDYFKAYSELVTDEAELYQKGLEQSLEIGREKESKYAEERWKIERKLTEDIAKFTHEEFEFKKTGLDEQRKIYEKFGIDRVRIDKWYQIELQKIEEERILRSNDFFAGMRVAYEQNLRDQTTWGQQGQKIWNSIFGKGGAVQNILSEGLFDFFKGELKTLEDYWNSFKNAVLRIVAQMIAEIMAKWAAAQFASLFGLGGGVSWGNIGTAALAKLGIGAAPSAAGGGAGVGAIGPAVAGAGGTGIAATGGGAAIAGVTSMGAGESAMTSFELGASGYYGTYGYGGAATGGGTTAAGAGGMSVAASVGLMGAGLAAWLAIAPMIAGPASTKIVNPFSSWAEFPELPSGAAQLAYSQVARQGNYPLSSIKELFPDSWWSAEKLANQFKAELGIEPSRESSLERSAGGQLYFNWLASKPEFQNAINELNRNREKYIGFVPQESVFGGSVGMAEGGIIKEPIFGRGMRTGIAYKFGEEGPERISPMKNNQDMPNNVTVNLNFYGNLVADKKTFNDFVEQIRYRLSHMKQLGYT